MVTRSRRKTTPSALGLGVAMGLSLSVNLGGCNLIAGIHEGIADPCAADDAGCGGRGGGGADPGEDGGSSAAAGSAMTELPSGSSTGADARAICGDGVIDPSEECDDQNSSTSDGCTKCVVDCAGTGTFKHPDSHHCYKLSGLKLSFEQAAFACGLSGGYLAAITSDTELDAMSTLIHEETWIGGSDVGVEGEYVWSSGEAWGSARWRPGEPSGDVDHHDCIKLTGSPIALDDADCTEKRSFLCERSPIGQPR